MLFVIPVSCFFRQRKVKQLCSQRSQIVDVAKKALGTTTKNATNSDPKGEAGQATEAGLTKEVEQEKKGSGRGPGLTKGAGLVEEAEEAEEERRERRADRSRYVCTNWDKTGFRATFRKPMDGLERIGEDGLDRDSVEAAYHPRLASTPYPAYPPRSPVGIRFVKHNSTAHAAPAKDSEDRYGAEGKSTTRPGQCRVLQDYPVSAPSFARVPQVP